jgi:hypothetical protein
MSTILNVDIINNAKDAVNAYVNTVTELYTRLKSEVDNITSDGFKGDASQGYLEFFNTNIVPMLTTNLTGDGSVTAGLNKLLDDINETVLATVDPKLGDANRSAGSSSSTDGTV